MTTNTDIEAARREASAARFTKRLTIFEDPAVIAELEEIAGSWGRSLAAEVRAALRYWLQTVRPES